MKTSSYCFLKFCKRKHKFNLEDKILLKADKIIDKKLNIEAYINMCYDIQILKKMLIEKNLLDFISIPSYNIDNEESLINLNLFFDKKPTFCIDNEIPNFINEDFINKRQNRKLWENYLNSIL